MEHEQVHDWEARPELRRLQDLSQTLKGLYYRGAWDASMFADCVAVVGSRRMTEYGRRVMDKLIPQLVMQKKTIVSGFMYGVDQYAHRLALDNGGKTIAVLGWGIKQELGSSDKELGRRIIDNGSLLISEWEIQKAALWTFPQRNRIVAALSTDVYVIEAALKSGSLITAELAITLNRTVWAVPGPITSKTSEGTNMLIATGKAKMYLGNNNQETRSKKQTISNNPIIQILENEAMTTDEVARKLGLPVNEVGAQLSMLTLMGQVVERKGKYYVE